MSNITKNLVLGLALVSVIVLIVFSIQLIILNVGGDAEENGASLATNQQGNEDADAGDPFGDNEDEHNIPPPPFPVLHGTRYEFRVSNNQVLVVYVDELLFNFGEGDSEWWFEHRVDDTTALDILFMPISPQGVSADAEVFLNEFMGGFDAVSGDEGPIHGSQISGFHVTGQHEEVLYEAWVHQLPHSELALVFVISYNSYMQRDALYGILSTMELIFAPTHTDEMGEDWYEDGNWHENGGWYEDENWYEDEGE